MSKVIITLDTVSKELEVKVDGTLLEDVKAVSIYCYEDYNDEETVSISINQKKESEEEGGLCTHTTLVASESGELMMDKDAPSYVQQCIGNFLKGR